MKAYCQFLNFYIAPIYLFVMAIHRALGIGSLSCASTLGGNQANKHSGSDSSKNYQIVLMMQHGATLIEEGKCFRCF